ncbi:hypothetical protein K4F52_001056 [Lecanicillium sp. MT-2017a]|nr:hypothetical protein K4F52_001056 [Lecanicillium sp. MT-2017a]
MTIAPYLVTTFVNGFISEKFVPYQWRVGLGMFAAMLPVVAAPAIAALYGVQRRANRLGYGASMKAKQMQESLTQTVWKGFVAIDLPGLILLGFSFSLILLPLSLAKSAHNGWRNPSMIAMEAIGFVILGIFIAYEVYLAPAPIMSKRILVNKVFLAGLGANLFNQMVGTLGSNYFSSYMYVIKDWDNYTWTVFTGIQFLAVTVFSLVGGVLQVKYHRYKTQMVIGAVCQVVGYAMCLTGKGQTTQSTVILALSQILMGMSALTALGSRVGAMASVTHKDMASIIAAYFLWTYLGSAAGYAIASAIWTANMPGFMRQELPGVSDEIVNRIYGSIEILRTDYEPGNPVREGAIRAYARTNGIIFITAAITTSEISTTLLQAQV